METVRSFNTALLSLHTRQESSRTVRTSWSIFRCFLFFDICYLLSGITLIIMAFTQEETEETNYNNREVMIMSGAGFGIFATISALCNSLACHGLKQWKKIFLIPWLSFYLLVLGIVTTCLLQALYSHNFLLQWRHIFLFFAIFTIFYCWSHVKKQYLMMMLPRPEQVTLDVESVVRDILRPHMAGTRGGRVVVESPPGDLPPKYEELDLPPQYDESTMLPRPEDTDNTTSNTTSSSSGAREDR